ncbi:hypothetical protein ANCDUO_03107 [Ancylostoma duodenale]|uniref:Protein arginine N-methyltransferase n=1 Tax=Ancylostoma duodenale TaxID=51022 RepID=A0A0C2DA09_9BILA|nr:hypothetical protein ANCDUO_03107 [Ancylostoma duodenale]
MKYSLYLARKYAAEGWWDRAIRHYLTVLFTYPNSDLREVEFSEEFRTVLENEGESGISSYDNLKAAINAECDPLMAAVFRVSSANIRSCNFDQWHMLMINDKDRNEKFLEALRNTILPTDYVLDIGTGTGLMSVFAASCGASKICAIESNTSLYNLAKMILSLNHVEGAKLIRDYSFNYHPEDGDLADVVVSEILDCCAFGEGVIPTFLDAHLRLATNMARFIPASVSLFATLIESPTIYLNHAFTSPSGKEFRSEYVRALIWGDEYIDTSESTCWEQGIFPLPYPVHVHPNRELILRGERDYRTMNNDMLLLAITRLLPSVSRYSWNLDINLSEEEASVVRNLPHFLIDSKDIEGSFGCEVDEANSELCIIVWPIRADGSVSEVFLNSLRILRSGKDIPSSLKYCGFLTDRLSAHGVLVSSSKLSQLTRVQPSSSCGADLSPIRMYNLLEYRDIDISTFEHHVCSNEFRFLHLGQEDTELLSKNIEVNLTCDVYCGSILLSAEVV